MKLKTLRIPALLAVVLVLGACASVPTSPSVMVLPGDGMSFDQFRIDEADCRQYATQQSSGTAAASNNATANGAVVGALVGALAGAAIDGKNGAGTGAGLGLLMGSTAGSSQTSSYGLQRRYDNAFVQCMYAKGHKVPGVTATSRRTSTTTTAPVANAAPAVPPPPPGLPPPPPPGVGVQR